MSQVWVWVWVAAAGGVGAVLRFLVDRSVARRVARAFPLGTLAVNLTGAVALGALTAVGANRAVSLILGTALIGSYTTFSTWMLETHRLAEERQSWAAMVNIVSGIALGLVAIVIGLGIGGLM